MKKSYFASLVSFLSFYPNFPPLSGCNMYVSTVQNTGAASAQRHSHSLLEALQQCSGQQPLPYKEYIARS